MTADWTWDKALCGVIPPMISPLTADGRADTEAVARVAEHILRGGGSGLFVLGGVGQGAWLSSAERAAIVRASVRAAAGRAPVLVGVMLPGTAPVREAALQAVDAGADALVVGSPYYYAVDAASQQRHVEAILAATSATGPALQHPAMHACAAGPRGRRGAGGRATCTGRQRLVGRSTVFPVAVDTQAAARIVPRAARA